MTETAIIERIRKLMRLAKDGGATEAEAALAAEKAQEIMAQHCLTMAVLEASGSDAGSDAVREKGSVEKRAMYEWQRDLMSTLAKVNYCFSEVNYSYSSRRRVAKGYTIIGRAANVAAVQVAFDYLCTTIGRAVMEELGGDKTRRHTNYAASFCKGCADRLVVRLDLRHRKIEEEQAREARQRKAASSHPAAAVDTYNALVVLSDWGSTEEDLNNDFRWNKEPGTTARQRIENEARWDKAAKERQAKIDEMVARGIDPRVAEMVARGYDLEVAIETIRKRDKPETEKQRQRREEKEARDNERWSRRYWSKQDRIDSAGYRKGQDAGDRIGLDPQIKKGKSQQRIG